MPSRSARASKGSGAASRRSSRTSARSRTAKPTRSATPSSALAWTTDGWIVPRSGLTYEPWTDERGVAAWISSLAARPARDFPSPASAAASTTPATFSPTPSASSESVSRQGSFWKMCLARCRTSFMSSCPSYRQWATELRQDSSARRTSARPTGESGSSCSVTWPTVDQFSDSPSANKRANQKNRQSNNTLAAAALNLWPTAQANDGTGSGYREVYHGEQLANQVSRLGLPVPRSGIGGPKSLSGGPNSRQLWATPNAADGTGGHHPSEVSAKRGGNRTLNRNLQEMDYPLRLNPLFVEWLMGLPCSWTVAVPGAVRAFGTQRDTPECTD